MESEGRQLEPSGTLGPDVEMSERRHFPFVLIGEQGRSRMDQPDELRALARKCRDLAASMLDEETSKSLELLASEYEQQAAALEAKQHRPDMPNPE